MCEHPNKIGLYIHVPFCIKRCAYCDFATDLERKGQRTLYMSTLKDEIELYAGKNYLIDSIYFGGGTPSLLQTSEVAEILSWVSEVFEVLASCEVTLEGNPDSLKAHRISALMDVGINRFSVGIQTLNREELDFLGRGHLIEENFETIDALCKAQVRFNIDLMLGIPKQSITSFEKTLSLLPIDSISHVSAYILSVEEEAPWFEKIQNGSILLPPEEMEVEAYFLLKDFLEDKGIFQYEISAYARKGQESLHNLKYWENKNYLGIGPSAGSYINRVRWQNQKSLDLWQLQINGKTSKLHYEEYTSKNAILETIMLEFRKICGIDKQKLYDWDSSYPDLCIKEKIERLLTNGRIELCKGNLRISRNSLLFANEVFLEFIE
ncbi:radical SAM family heme chaperone HemW [bacterium]|nr:radical SAM family heme chaperone HemW [bacterium]